jgi:adenylate cyclase class 2
MFRTNVEFKAYCDTPFESVASACSALGAVSVCTVAQTDTYFRSRFGRLNLRSDRPGGATLIFYDRADAPAPRESRSEAVAVSSPGETAATLSSALGIRCTTHKVRQVYQTGAALIHVDEVDGLGRFLDVVVDVEQAGDVTRAREVAEQLLPAFGLSQADIVPWSYGDLQSMSAAASDWRARLAARPNRGTLFLLDGASASGKSTLVNRLTRDSGLPLHLVPRYSTRARRQDDERCGGEYIFTSHDVFRDLAFGGGFIEYRDFQFGMSYGLPWAEASAPLMEGRHAMGVINLGNVRHVKSVLPEAVTILVDASQQTIRQRLISRGVNTPEQIEERLANAARVEAYRPLYDYVVVNEDGTLREAEDTLRDLILGVRRSR